MVNFCDALSRLCMTHPRDFPRLKAIRVAKVPKHLLRQRATTAMSDEQNVMPERSFERCLFLVKRLKGLGFPLALLSVKIGYDEWPGKKQAREIAQFVDCFMYNETTVYDYEALKASQIAWQANMLETMREIQGPDFEWPPDEEFED
ncbi:hypothetical protein BDZ89DRAFT_1140492 [Hymenopellis radicata]|nr:hypothetical protein BDZ89DRAFT_1140492 [Hymenopellis radicata]